MNVGLQDKANLTESQMPFESSNKGWKRIFSYYKPWYMNIAIGFFSFFNTFGFFAIGIFVSSLLVLFTMYEAGKTGTKAEVDIDSVRWSPGTEDGTIGRDEFIYYKRNILLAWVSWLALSFIIGGSNKACFVLMGE